MVELRPGHPRGEHLHRRSLYTFWKRGMAPPQMTILDAPTRESCVARRERTNTPLQALLLMNEQQYLKAARQLANRVLADGPRDAEARVDLLYETMTARLPEPAARAALVAAAADLEAMYAADAAQAEALCAGTVPAGPGGASELAAWTLVASAVQNLDLTRTRD